MDANQTNSSRPFRAGKAGGRKKKQLERPISQRELKKKSEAKELDELNEKVKNLDEYTGKSIFSELPLSRLCMAGLSKSNFVEMTEIQKVSLPISLSGRDVLGAAKTGSGKTLAFVIPIMEKLYREKWSLLDGLGALVVSPTRELALQIFEVVRKVGRFYSFSAGLLIGGKDLVQEQERIAKMNILVCTPGRLLQHMDQTPDFTCDNLQILVLDEADRCLDGGFEKTLNAIIANLPQQGRQTLLFSATQTKSVKDLARLSLVDPEYVNVHEASDSATPQTLTQRYAVIDLSQKLDMLFSFLKTHLKQKILVFASSCKQVRFIFETFCKLHPGIPLMHMHGKQKQPKRLAIFETFCRKTAICLFATDVAARGLDFPAVDWVIQLDCPEDVSTYIHRVGRTARYEQVGNALMFLTPDEESGMLEALAKRKVVVEKIRVNPSKIKSIRQQMVMFCSKDPEIKYLGQKTFISYIRSIHLQANKEIFDVSKLPLEAFAESLGLPGAPVVKFIKKSANGAKNAVRQKAKDLSNLGISNDELVEESSADESATVAKTTKKQPLTKVEKMFQAKNKTVLSEHYQKMRADDGNGGDNEDEDFFGVVRRNHDVEDGYPEKAPTKKELTKAKIKELTSRGLSKKIEFDEEGNPIDNALETLEEFEAKGSIASRQAQHLEVQTKGMKVADVEDKDIVRQKRKEKRLLQKVKERAAMGLDAIESGGVRVAVDVDSGDESQSEKNDNSDGEFEDDGSSVTFDGERGSFDRGAWESDAELSSNADDGESSENLNIDLDEDFVMPARAGKRGNMEFENMDEDANEDTQQLKNSGVKRKKQKLSSYLAKTQDLESIAANLLKKT